MLRAVEYVHHLTALLDGETFVSGFRVPLFGGNLDLPEAARHARVPRDVRQRPAPPIADPHPVQLGDVINEQGIILPQAPPVADEVFDDVQVLARCLALYLVRAALIAPAEVEALVGFNRRLRDLPEGDVVSLEKVEKGTEGVCAGGKRVGSQSCVSVQVTQKDGGGHDREIAVVERVHGSARHGTVTFFHRDGHNLP